MPRIAYINKMDIVGADFFNVIKMMKERLGANAVPIQLPIGKEDNFGYNRSGRTKAIYYTDDLGTHSEETDIPEDMLDLVRNIGYVAGGRSRERRRPYDEVPGRGGAVPERSGRIRKATISVDMIPVLCGSSYKNREYNPY